MPGRRFSGSSTGAPPKKRRLLLDEPAETVALDPNAIDHSLDLAPHDDGPTSHLDSFSLSLFEDELNVATEAVIQGTTEHPAEEEEEEEEDMHGKGKKKKKSKQRQSGQQSTAAVAVPEVPPKLPVMDIAEIKQKYGKMRLERIRRQAIKDAWKEYQEETSRVVQQLPEEITSMFGQIGYGKFGKKWFPVLLICPFGTY